MPVRAPDFYLARELAGSLCPDERLEHIAQLLRDRINAIGGSAIDRLVRGTADAALADLVDSALQLRQRHRTAMHVNDPLPPVRRTVRQPVRQQARQDERQEAPPANGRSKRAVAG